MHALCYSQLYFKSLQDKRVNDTENITIDS